MVKRVSEGGAGVVDKKVKKVDESELYLNGIRYISAQQPGAANSGHPGAPMGCAPMAHALFGHVMTYSASDPHYPNRDRFVLSNGHACALQYTMLCLGGYLEMDDLKNFRQLSSRTPGHPENFATPGVELCTGPLGQGISNAVGLAIGAHHVEERYKSLGKNLFDNHIFVICGDGCLQEGVSAEASSLAGHLGLGKLIVLYDANNITIDGNISLAFTEDVLARYRAYGWHTCEVLNGDSDMKDILLKIEQAKKIKNKPSIIKVNTTIGFGDEQQGTEKIHGAPVADLQKLKKNYGLPDSLQPFEFPAELGVFYDAKKKENVARVDEWYDRVRDLVLENMKKIENNDEKELIIDFIRRYILPTTTGSRLGSLKLPALPFQISKTHPFQLPFSKLTHSSSMSQEAVLSLLPHFDETSPSESTRSLSGKCLNVLTHHLSEFIGGSADLAQSNSTVLKQLSDLQKDNFQNRYIRFGVREHAMCAISNGLYAFGGFRPFAATFLNFITYAWGSVRISALSNFPILYIATHDSLELGEDGPTHQPIEVFCLLRATPNLILIRPCDGKEVVGAYGAYLAQTHSPVVLSLCRGNLPHLKNTNEKHVLKGAYVISHTSHNIDTMKEEKKQKNEQKKNDKNHKKDEKNVLLAASGTEVTIALEAKELLEKENFKVKVVSFPSWELFAQQSAEYRQATLPSPPPSNICSLLIEPAATYGWHQYFNTHVGVNSFGASAPKQALFQKFNLTPQHILHKVKLFFK